MRDTGCVLVAASVLLRSGCKGRFYLCSWCCEWHCKDSNTLHFIHNTLCLSTMHGETFQILLPPTRCPRTQCLLLMVVRKASIEGNACVLGSLCQTVYVYLQDITFQEMLWILCHYNLQTFVLESYSLMNVFLEWEQLLQLQLEISPKCQLGWSFEVPWGECSCLCNPIFLFEQPVSITWQVWRRG